jgi:hypothetical protein
VQGNGTGQQPKPAAPAAPRLPVVRDEKTGETYLKVPVPSAEAVEQALKAVGALLEGFRR